MKVRNSLFWHVYDSTTCSKIIDNVTQTIFVAIYIGHDWELSCILRLSMRSKLSVTDSLRFLIPKIYISREALLIYFITIRNEQDKIIFVATLIGTLILHRRSIDTFYWP